jgi:hypothetical protein
MIESNVLEEAQQLANEAEIVLIYGREFVSAADDMMILYILRLGLACLLVQ